MGFGSKLNSAFSTKKSVNPGSKVSIIKSKDVLCVVDNGNVRMRFTSVRSADLKDLKSPLYSLLVP